LPIGKYRELTPAEVRSLTPQAAQPRKTRARRSMSSA
jgi:hypothetical protein